MCFFYISHLVFIYWYTYLYISTSQVSKNAVSSRLILENVSHPHLSKTVACNNFPLKKIQPKHHWGMFRWMFLFENVAIHGFFHDHLCHLRKVRTSSKRTEICFGGWEVRGRFFSGAKRYICQFIYIYIIYCFFEHKMLNLWRKSPDFFRSLRVCSHEWCESTRKRCVSSSLRCLDS